jgi:hypothetical protein
MDFDRPCICPASSDGRPSYSPLCPLHNLNNIYGKFATNLGSRLLEPRKLPEQVAVYFPLATDLSVPPGETTLFISPRCVFRPKHFVVRRLARKALLFVTEIRIGLCSIFYSDRHYHNADKEMPLWELHCNSSIIMSTIGPEHRAWLKVHNRGPRAVGLSLDIEGIGIRPEQREAKEEHDG